MASPPRLETRALTVERGGRAVARDVDLRLEAGEVVALVGPSGTGKSSFLRSLVRLDEPAAAPCSSTGGTRARSSRRRCAGGSASSPSSR